MITAINQIIHQVFRKNNLEELNREEVYEYVKNHPYSSTGRLIYALKTRPENQKDEADDISLYFFNPAWYGLLKSNLTQIAHEPPLPLEPTVSPSGGLVLDAVKTGDSIEEELKESFTTDEVKIEEEVPYTTEENSAENSSDESEAISVENKEEEVDNKENEETQNESPIITAEKKEIIPENENLTEEFEAISSEINNEEQEEDNHLREEMVKETQEITEKKTETPGNSGNLLFIPYHSVDFFASQGIKLTENELGKDKFGKQLKSFTEWLKSMKKLPAREEDTELDKVAEVKLSRIAEASLSEHLIITEAMAEVWEKQGNFGKAIEIYEKLSLQNPSKSHYFADKIQKIKK